MSITQLSGKTTTSNPSLAMEFARSSPKNLKLILTARRIDALNQLAEEIKEEVGTGVRVLALKLDVSNPEEVRGFVGCLPSDFKDLGRFFRIQVGSFHEDDWVTRGSGYPVEQAAAIRFIYSYQREMLTGVQKQMSW